MRKGGGKAKGASFEREICRALSLWVSAGKHEDLYWRSAMSGGRSTVAHAKGKRLAAQAGDISCVNALGHKLTDQFLIECKNYRDFDFTSLILSRRGKLAEFWKETKVNAAKYEKHPMLIGKQNRFDTFVCLGSAGISGLLLDTSPSIRVPNINLFIIRFDHFLACAHLS